MFASLKKVLKWGSTKSLDCKKPHSSLMLAAFIGLLEDVLLWKKMWLSLSCIFFLNAIFFICIHWQINVLELLFCICATIISIDAFETWLKYKHRTACLKRIANHDSTEFTNLTMHIKTGFRRRWVEFVYLRETNHTKAFLLVNILFSIIFLTGKYISGYVFLYLASLLACILYKIAPPVLRIVKKIQQHAESDCELEGLIPEVSEMDIKLLSIEPEQPTIDDRHSLDYWKPEDIPLGDASDSSENSSSLVRNLSIEKMKTFDNDVETSDSSEDEYIPIEQRKEQLQSTLEVVEPTSTWGSTAYNALFNMAHTVTNMVYTAPVQQRKRVSSIDSSDGFEMIDKNELN